MLEILRESGGTALTVSEEEIAEGISLVNQNSELDPAPEAAAAVMGAKKLLEDGFIKGDEKIVVFITGNNEKYKSLY